MLETARVREGVGIIHRAEKVKQDNKFIPEFDSMLGAIPEQDLPFYFIVSLTSF